MTNVARPGFVSVSEYRDLPRSPETWLLKPLIPVSGAALLYGQEKGGKTALAIQLAAAISGTYDNWLGFPVGQAGRTLYLQLDTPRSTFSLRFDKLHKAGVAFNDNLVKLADRECLETYPFDILQPAHMKYLHSIIQPLHPVAVIIDTLREIHSGDEDSSTIMRNVITNLVGATHPAALILISHSRKPHPDVDRNLMTDHRGSSYTTGRMDAIMRLARNRLFYGGRSIEDGDIKLSRQDVDGALLWEPELNNDSVILQEVLLNPELVSMRSKARALAVRICKTEDACMSMIRRTLANTKHTKEVTTRHEETSNQLS